MYRKVHPCAAVAQQLSVDIHGLNTAPARRNNTDPHCRPQTIQTRTGHSKALLSACLSYLDCPYLDAHLSILLSVYCRHGAWSDDIGVTTIRSLALAGRLDDTVPQSQRPTIFFEGGHQQLSDHIEAGVQTD